MSIEEEFIDETNNKYRFHYFDYTRSIWMATTPEPTTVFRCTNHLPQNIKKLLEDEIQYLRENYTKDELDNINVPIDPASICDFHVHSADNYLQHFCSNNIQKQWVDTNWYITENDLLNYNSDSDEECRFEYSDKKCGVCAFQEGINKVRETLYKSKVFRIMEKKWITPGPDGSCGYANWSWRKMKEELECEGVQFV